MFDSKRLDVQITDRRELRTLNLPPVYDGIPADSLKGKVRIYVALEKERRELEARLKLIEDEAKPLREEIADAFEESGTQRENVDGLTVFLRYQQWARPKDGDQARLCAALKQSGMGELVQEVVNVNTMSAVVREKLQEAREMNIPDNQILPAPVMDALEITTSRSLRSMTGRTPRGKGQPPSDD